MVFYSNNKFVEQIKELLEKKLDSLYLYSVKEFYEENELLNIFIEDFENVLTESPNKEAFLTNEHLNNSLDKYLHESNRLTDELRIQIFGYKDAINSVNKNLKSTKPINDYYDNDELIYYTFYLLGYTKSFYIEFLKNVQKLGINTVRINIEAAKKENQKLAWLYELGVLELIKNRFTKNNSTNYRKAGEVIASFTDINSETVRKALDALYNSNPNNKNNPTNSKSSKEFVLKRLKEFKLEILHKEFKKQDSF